MPTTALDVAKYMILLAASEEEPERLSPMQLQKLVYYAQGWSLALRDKALFTEPIQAWAYGPVVPSVFQEFKRFEDRQIDAELGSDENLTEEQKGLIRSVWKEYKRFSAIGLSEMTHREAPWRDARSGLPPGTRSEREITRRAMKAFFEAKARA